MSRDECQADPDTLAGSVDAPVLTAAQRSDLDRRLDDLDRDGPIGSSWEEMLARVRASRTRG